MKWSYSKFILPKQIIEWKIKIKFLSWLKPVLYPFQAVPVCCKIDSSDFVEAQIKLLDCRAKSRLDKIRSPMKPPNVNLALPN